MKKPPDDPEFAKFTAAMRGIMKVSKEELNRRIEAERISKQKHKEAKVSVTSEQQTK